MTAGPLSMPKQDKDEFRRLDTAEKRDEEVKTKGSIHTGKTEKSRRKGSPVKQENAPKNLARRLRDFSNMGDKAADSGAYHRPGSQKK